jgi:hypothetical protein
MIRVLDHDYPTLRDALLAIARTPATCVRLTVEGIPGGVPLHGARLARALRDLPREWSAALDTGEDDDLRLVLSWHTPLRRGRLTLRALGTIALGPAARDALAECRRYPDRRLKHLPRDQMQALRRLGWAPPSATLGVLLPLIIARGWAAYTDAPVTTVG